MISPSSKPKKELHLYQQENQQARFLYFDKQDFSSPYLSNRYSTTPSHYKQSLSPNKRLNTSPHRQACHYHNQTEVNFSNFFPSKELSFTPSYSLDKSSKNIDKPRPTGMVTKRINNKNINEKIIEYLCGTCRELIWNPIKCSSCHQHYCKSCSKYLTQCPFCYNPMKAEAASQSLLLNLNNLEMSCAFSGCKESLSYSTYPIHIINCPFATFDKKEKQLKKFRCVHCSKPMLIAQRKTHENECQLRLIPCQQCLKDVPLVHMTSHIQFRCKGLSPQTAPIKIEKYLKEQCPFCTLEFFKYNLQCHFQSCPRKPKIYIPKSQSPVKNRDQNKELRELYLKM